VDHTLKDSKHGGLIPMSFLVRLYEAGYEVWIVGAYGNLKPKWRAVFPDGKGSLSKLDVLKRIKRGEKGIFVYVGDTKADEIASEKAGWKFIHASKFTETALRGYEML